MAKQPRWPEGKRKRVLKLMARIERLPEPSRGTILHAIELMVDGTFTQKRHVLRLLRAALDGMLTHDKMQLLQNALHLVEQEGGDDDESA